MSLQIYVNFSGIGSSVKKSLEGIIRKKTNTVCTLMSTYWLICTVNYIFLGFFSHLNIMSLREKKLKMNCFSQF